MGGGSINDKRESNKQRLSSAKRDWKCEEKRQYIGFFCPVRLACVSQQLFMNSPLTSSQYSI